MGGSKSAKSGYELGYDIGLQQAPTYGTGQSTPNVFRADQRYMPSEYFGNQPIEDPTAILNAYKQNLPAFAQAARSVVNKYQ